MTRGEMAEAMSGERGHQWEVDGSGYPTEESLTDLQRHLRELPPSKVATWLVEEFPRLVQSIPFGNVTVRYVADVRDGRHDPGTYEIEYSTEGWSGQEFFIETVMKAPAVKYYYHAWEAGGHHSFRVPEERGAMVVPRGKHHARGSGLAASPFAPEARRDE